MLLNQHAYHFFKPVERMLNDWQGRGMIVRQCFGAIKGCLAPLARDCLNFWIVADTTT